MRPINCDGATAGCSHAPEMLPRSRIAL